MSNTQVLHVKNTIISSKMIKIYQSSNMNNIAAVQDGAALTTWQGDSTNAHQQAR
jgi:hypothetical protein